MNLNPITQSVEMFARALANTPDPALERPWKWLSYDTEGVRFAFFRTYEELSQLAVQLQQYRQQSESPLTETQRILGQYHAAYRDLQAALLGLNPAQMDQSPAEQEWPMRQVIAHVLGSDVGFYVVTRFALDTARQGRPEPQQVTEEAWGQYTGLDEAGFDAMMQGTAAELMTRLEENHDRVMRDFATIREKELEDSSIYWEKEPYSLRFRLHRFHSHMRQHTIQVDKTLAALGLLPGEPRRLLRLIYAALAETEGALIGIDPAGVPELEVTAKRIDARLKEMVAAVTG